MRLIVDSNIVFAGLLRDSTTRALLVDPPFELSAPETMLREIRKHEDTIINRSNLAPDEFHTLFGVVTDYITIVEMDRYQDALDEANQLIGDKDKGDVPFLALALTVPNDGIWTQNVQDFQGQDSVRIWTTGELLETLDSRF